MLHREILRAAARIYPAPRLLDLLTPGMSSKSNRTRIEAAEYLGECIETHGLAPAIACRSKPLGVIVVVGAWGFFLWGRGGALLGPVGSGPCRRTGLPEGGGGGGGREERRCGL